MMSMSPRARCHHVRDAVGAKQTRPRVLEITRSVFAFASPLHRHHRRPIIAIIVAPSSPPIVAIVAAIVVAIVAIVAHHRPSSPIVAAIAHRRHRRRHALPQCTGEPRVRPP
jgi:hypothetical protein